MIYMEKKIMNYAKVIDCDVYLIKPQNNDFPPRHNKEFNYRVAHLRNTQRT